uniref:Putative secreted peptide n=1 Tax=Rhipicephalus pulchellus TaxID=72859 RepID=L7M9Y1_RHIPC
MAMVAAGLAILLVCFVARTNSQEANAPSTCPPPDPMCDCKPTRDEISGCLLCMCHEGVPPAACPQVRCPIQEDNQCFVEIRDGCSVCNCTQANVQTAKHN